MSKKRNRKENSSTRVRKSELVRNIINIFNENTDKTFD